MSNETLDLYTLYKIIKSLTTPFDETKAFELGLIDADGKLLRKPKTSEEKSAYGYYDKFVFNIKRIMAKVGLKGKTATFAAALFLLREENSKLDKKDTIKEILRLMEDANVGILYEEIANVTGAAVAGTGDDSAHWINKKKRDKTLSYVKRMAKQKGMKR